MAKKRPTHDVEPDEPGPLGVATKPSGPYILVEGPGGGEPVRLDVDKEPEPRERLVHVSDVGTFEHCGEYGDRWVYRLVVR
jgi:hypothetical protein